jgi:hypothetical protein
VIAFFDLFYSIRLRQGGEDRIWWIPSKRKFEVGSFFYKLSNLRGSYFPWKSIWKVNIPLRVSFFVWTTAIGKILTLDNLRKRRVIVVEWFCMCKRSVKSIYLLIYCELARKLWTVIFGFFEVEWVMPRRVIELSDC